MYKKISGATLVMLLASCAQTNNSSNRSTNGNVSSTVNANRSNSKVQLKQQGQNFVFDITTTPAEVDTVVLTTNGNSITLKRSGVKTKVLVNNSFYEYKQLDVNGAVVSEGKFHTVKVPLINFNNETNTLRVSNYDPKLSYKIYLNGSESLLNLGSDGILKLDEKPESIYCKAGLLGIDPVMSRTINITKNQGVLRNMAAPETFMTKLLDSSKQVSDEEIDSFLGEMTPSEMASKNYKNAYTSLTQGIDYLNQLIFDEAVTKEIANNEIKSRILNFLTTFNNNSIKANTVAGSEELYQIVDKNRTAITRANVEEILSKGFGLTKVKTFKKIFEQVIPENGFKQESIDLAANILGTSDEEFNDLLNVQDSEGIPTKTKVDLFEETFNKICTSENFSNLKIEKDEDTLSTQSKSNDKKAVKEKKTFESIIRESSKKEPNAKSIIDKAKAAILKFTEDQAEVLIDSAETGLTNSQIIQAFVKRCNEIGIKIDYNAFFNILKMKTDEIDTQDNIDDHEKIGALIKGYRLMQNAQTEAHNILTRKKDNYKDAFEALKVVKSFKKLVLKTVLESEEDILNAASRIKSKYTNFVGTNYKTVYTNINKDVNELLKSIKTKIQADSLYVETKL
jgi:hypothetical protein